MLPFRRATYVVDGLKLHVMEDGDPNGRPVLLLHGNPTWGFVYRKVALALRGSGLRLIMPDLVGLGLSDKPGYAEFHSLARHGELISKLIHQLGLSDLIFVGQDWGGPIGLRALAHDPKLLSGLVLLNTAIGPPKPGFRPTPFHRFSQLPVVSDVTFRLLGFPQNILPFVQGDRKSIAGRTALAYLYPLRDPRTNTAPLALARLVPDSLEHPSVPDLRITQEVACSFSGPTAIVWGDADPILGRVRTHLERLLPRAAVTRTTAGHFLQEEVPEEIAAAIRHVAAG
jgi:haloalkane dehalogenase